MKAMIKFHVNAFKMLTTFSAWALLFCPGLWAEISQQSTNAFSLTPQTQNLLLYLKKAPEKGILFGHHESTAYGVGWRVTTVSDKASRSDVESVCGDYPAVIGWDIGKIEHGNNNNINGVPFEVLRSEIIAHYLRGGINMVCWHIDNPLTGGSSWDVKDKKVVESILPGGDLHDKFLGWLDNAAECLNSLRAPDSTKIPVIFRPWHEHTGSWFWWGQDNCTAEQFKALWRLTCDRLRQKGCDHLLYAYSPSNDIARAIELYMERYPGDDYVDILGYDSYQHVRDNSREEYMQRMNRMLSYLTELGKKHQKPIACTETGYETIPSENWWTGTLLPCTESHPVAFITMWRYAHERHFYAPHPKSICKEDFFLYHENPRMLFSSDLRGVYGQESEPVKALPRSTPEAENVAADMLENYLTAIQEAKQEIHSVMVLRNGKVIAEKYLGDAAANKNHAMYSVSKTFTATAIGFAVQEGLLKVSDKVISFFPDELPESLSENLQNLEIRHLLTMSTGHDKDPTQSIRQVEGTNWMKEFLAVPLEHPPGSRFVYNSLATYALSAIIQKVTGEKLIDYLHPRLFRPLGIASIRWDESPQGINCGGWGLWLKTEDMAKMGQFLLQKGAWNGKQLLSQEWIEEATRAHIDQPPAWVSEQTAVESSDWRQGYGYQLWRCRHNAFRADGAYGQFIIVIPEKETVVAITAHLGDMQAEINLVWEHILNALK